MKCARLMIAVFFALLASRGSGCSASSSRSVSLSAWQHNVENYVRVQGQGDPTVLRDTTLADGRKGYAMLGNPVMKESTDAVGLLLGAPRVGESPALVYLVGIVQRGKTTDLRLAVLRFRGGQLYWTVGASNPQSVAGYLKYRDAEWRASSPQRHDAPLLAEAFPALGDVFTLNTSDDRVAATHQQTGASWSVTLDGGR